MIKYQGRFYSSTFSPLVYNRNPEMSLNKLMMLFTSGIIKIRYTCVCMVRSCRHVFCIDPVNSEVILIADLQPFTIIQTSIGGASDNS